MGGFSFIRLRGDGDSRKSIETSRRQFQRSGFGAPTSIETADFVFDYYGKIAYDSRNILQFDQNNFIASAGTLILDGRTGREALAILFDEADCEAALSRARGHFAVVICRKGAVSLLRDRNSSHEVYYDSSFSIVSTSYLAVARARGDTQLNAQEIYEYVFQGAPFGSRTPLSSVHRLDLGERMELAPRTSIQTGLAEPLLPEAEAPRDDLVAEHVGQLRQFFADLAGIFGSRITMGLSGGYDSRLMLALFRANGVEPQLVVYGNGDTEDVAAAKRIAAAERLPLRHIDKSRLGPEGPDDRAAAARENFEREDGLPLHGILERDHERFARLELGAGGMLHIHGGGGEIYRNFFGLPDRPLSPRDLVRSFFNAFEPRVCTDALHPRDYEAALSGKLLKLVGRDKGRLSRREIEYIYPHFRCHSWFSRENSLNSRYFHSILPFYEGHIVRQALRIPVRYKHSGNFESRMIRQADPALARHISNYGHDFTADAPALRALGDRLKYWRPALVRLHGSRIKARRALRKAPPALAAKPFFAELVDGFPFMSRYFAIDRIRDEVHFSRLCALEYLCQTIEADRARGEAAARQISTLAKALPQSLGQPQPESASA